MQKINKILTIIIMIFFTTKAVGNYDRLAYDFSFTDLNGNKISLSDYKNKIIIIVNVASKCGFTNQYEDMQKIWNKYEKNGVIIIGVPSNNFGNQEPGSSTEIKNFCEAKFGITFPMTEKVNVIGEKAHPFYKWAKTNYGKSAIPKWNFHKIVIGKDGKIHDTFTSITNPSSGRFIKMLEKLI
jgi:glutathione peroxidase